MNFRDSTHGGPDFTGEGAGWLDEGEQPELLFHWLKTRSVFCAHPELARHSQVKCH